MTLKRKIILSNILIICIPVALALILWFGYVNSHRGMYMNPARTPDADDSSLYSMQYTLHLYENALTGMDLENGFTSGYDDPDIFPTEQMQRVGELSELGIHMQVEKEGKILFGNLDDADLDFLKQHAVNDPDLTERIDYYNHNIIIRNRVVQNSDLYLVTAVYNEHRVNTALQESLLPVFMVAPQVIGIFLIFVTASIVIIAVLTVRWLNDAILNPLAVLSAGAAEIAKGNLDEPLSFDGTDEFSEVCREFDSMRIKLKESSQQRETYDEKRRELLRGISHDLRSPLTSIRGYAEGLKDGIANTQEKKERYYDAILTRTADIERLLESLSVLVRLDAPAFRYQTEKVDLDEFFRQFIREESVYAEQNAVTFVYRSEKANMEAEIDIREMRRVFVNLLENTVKHRKNPASVIHLQIQKIQNPGMAEIRFRDDGPGVAEEQLEYIFDSFYRGDASRTRPETGSGLGLAVVKSIITGHGGTVAACNDDGLVISIRLPLC